MRRLRCCAPTGGSVDRGGLTSLLFVLIHPPAAFTPNGSVILMSIALILLALRIRTGSIVPPAFAHIAFNATVAPFL
jgi:membrane protease YdiL (CAAX protease family)